MRPKRVLALLALALVGCGGSSDLGGFPSPEPIEVFALDALAANNGLAMDVSGDGRVIPAIGDTPVGRLHAIVDGVLVSYDVPTLDPMPSSGFLLVSPNGRYLAGTGSTSEVHPRRYVFYLDLQEGVVKAVFGSQARSVTLTKIRDDGTLTGWYEVDRFPFDSTTYYFTFRPPERFEETTQPPDPPNIPTPAPSGYGEPRVFVYSHNERFAGGWVVEVTTGRTFGCVWDASGRATLLPRIEGVTAGEGVGWVSDDGTRALYDGHHDVRDEGLQALWVRGRTPILTETLPAMAGGPARPPFGRWFARAKAANGRYLSVDAGQDSGAQVYLVHVP